MNNTFQLLLNLILTVTLSAQTMEFEILVSSRNTHSVKKYNAETGEFVHDFISSGSGGLSYTQDVKIGKDGNVLVSGRGNTAVLQYDKSSGAYIKKFTSGYLLDNPTKIVFGPDGFLYVSQWGITKNKIVRFSGITGVFIDEFTPSINLALGHTWDQAGNLFVACYGSGDVRMYNTSGNFIRIFTETGYLQGPANVWFDTHQNLYVLDWVLGKVQKFDSSGNFVNTFVSGLTNAEGYAFGPDSHLYICDWTQNHIKKFSPNGAFLNIFASRGNLMAPNSMLFRPVQPTSVEEEPVNATNGFKLSQNFPNPFNSTTMIHYSVGDIYKKSPAKVVIKIFDMLGNEIAILVDEVALTGHYSIQLNMSNYNLTSGIYLIGMTAANFTRSINIVYLK